MTTALAAGATLVALAFAACLYERWLARRRPHELAWTAALVLFAGGSAALWTGAALGWDAPTFRAFYFFGAVANVPVLALGTVYLLAPRHRADLVAAVVGLAVAFAGGVLAVAPLTGAIQGDSLPQGSEAFGVLPRALAAVASGLGATVVFVGAAWSGVRLVRGRATRRLAAGNALLALGTVVLSASGLLNSVADEMQAFAISLTAGITILFAGFLVTTTGTRPEHAARPLRRVA